MAPSDEAELMHMIATAVIIDDGPSAIRYTRGEGSGVELPSRGTPLEIGRGRILLAGTSVAILGLGARVGAAIQAAEELAAAEAELEETEGVADEELAVVETATEGAPLDDAGAAVEANRANS